MNYSYLGVMYFVAPKSKYYTSCGSALCSNNNFVVVLLTWVLNIPFAWFALRIRNSLTIWLGIWQHRYVPSIFHFYLNNFDKNSHVTHAVINALEHYMDNIGIVMSQKLAKSKWSRKRGSRHIRGLLECHTSHIIQVHNEQ